MDNSDKDVYIHCTFVHYKEDGQSEVVNDILY